MNLTQDQTDQATSLAENLGLNPCDIIQEGLDLIELANQLGPDDFAALMQGIADADNGRFASEAAVRKVFDSFGEYDG